MAKHFFPGDEVEVPLGGVATRGHVVGPLMPRVWYVRFGPGLNPVPCADDVMKIVRAVVRDGDPVRIRIGHHKGKIVTIRQPDDRLCAVEFSPQDCPCGKGILSFPNCNHLFGYALWEVEPIVHAVPAKPGRAEAPCPRPGCRKPNDIGVRVCWSCGNPL